MADVDPALGQEIFDIAQRQRVSHVYHHDQTNDLRRVVEISKRVAHGPRLSRPEPTRAFALTEPTGLMAKPADLRGDLVDAAMKLLA
jgi:hypothetical protein